MRAIPSSATRGAAVGRRAAAVAILLLALAFQPAIAAASRGRYGGWRFGVVAFDLNGPVPIELAALGVGVVRGSCRWDLLEPARGVFDWRCTDNVIVGAWRQKLRSYMTVNCTPQWASHSGCHTLPDDAADWTDFVERFVARYRLYDTVLGVWNEPNLDLQDDPDGTRYALFFVNASNARNEVDPQFAIAGPEVSHHAMASGYYQHVMDTIETWRALNPQDIVAVHWYSDGPPLLQYLDAVHAVADRNQVWLSETGYSTADLARQADFYRSMLDTFAASRRAWWTHMIFYRLWDGTDCCSESLLTADFAAKPAFDAIRSWIDQAPGELDDPNPYIPPRQLPR